MAETTEPFDGGPYMTEAGWSSLWGYSMGNGVVTRATSTSTTNLAVYSDVDGRQIKISSGSAHIRGHRYVSTDIVVRQVAPNTSGYTRIDRVVLRLDTSGKNATPVVLTGTPLALNPQPPPMIQVVGGLWDIPLALVTVDSGFTTIAVNKITKNRVFAGTSDYTDFGAAVYPLNSSGTGSGYYAPSISADSGNFAQYRVSDMSCEVHVKQLVTGATGTGYEYAFLLPFPAAKINRQLGVASVQNRTGRVITVDNAYAIGGPTPGTDLGLVAIQLFDSPATNFTVPATTFDGFDMVYKMAPG